MPTLRLRGQGHKGHKKPKLYVCLSERGLIQSMPPPPPHRTTASISEHVNIINTIP